MPQRPHLFDRSGFASRDDLESPEWRELFTLLEAKQSRFLEREAQFRSSDYRWPSDALHNWSRVWEYPYVYHQFARWLAGREAEPQPLVADLGSGVTFLPFALAELGCRVICIDTDPVVTRDIPRAAEALGFSRERVEARLTDGARLPAADESFDAITCISVLEHVADPAGLIPEIARVLRPGGLFVLTIDVAVKGTRLEIGPAKHRSLKQAIDARFDYAQPARTVHPASLLTSVTGPYASRSRWPLWRFLRPAVHGVLRTIGRDRDDFLTCEAFTLSRR